MKKIVLIFLMLPFFTIAQNGGQVLPFKKKDQFISVQYGFPNVSKSLLESFPLFTQTNKKNFGPVSLSYDYHISADMSIGATLLYSSYSASYKDILASSLSFNGKLRNTAILVQSTKYLAAKEKLFLYAKGSIGLNLWSGEYTAPDGSDFKNFNAPTPVGYTAMVGGKYLFTPNMLGYLEAGYGKYIVAAGLSFKVR